MVLNQFVKASSLYKKTYLIYLGAREYLKNVKKNMGKMLNLLLKLLHMSLNPCFKVFFKNVTFKSVGKNVKVRELTFLDFSQIDISQILSKIFL